MACQSLYRSNLIITSILAALMPAEGRAAESGPEESAKLHALRLKPPAIFCSDGSVVGSWNSGVKFADPASDKVVKLIPTKASSFGTIYHLNENDGLKETSAVNR